MSAPVAFALPTENMDSKTLYVYAITQSQAWKLFADNLKNMESKNSVTIEDVEKWVVEHIDNFDNDMVRLATVSLIFEAIVKQFPDFAFETAERSQIETKIDERLKARKIVEPVVVEKPKKKTAGKKKTVEPVVEIPSDPVTTTEAAEPTVEPVVVEKPKKKSAGKKKETEVVEDNASDTSSKKSEKKKRGPTAYNLFIKAEMERLRAADTALNHKVAMAMAVAAWKAKANNTSETTTEEPTSEESVAHPIPEYPVENSVTLEQALESEL